MNGRPPALQAFLDQLWHTFQDNWASPEIRACMDRVFTALRHSGRPGGNIPNRLPVCAHLQPALARARRSHPALVDSFAELEPYLTWTRRPQSHPTASENFPEGHANALIVGPQGHEAREDVWVGVSLLAPHVRYPDHDHSPEEVYVVLSDSRFQHGNDAWFAPGIGGQFHNIPNIRHAMASGDEPLFAIWCLPVDQGDRRQ